MNIQSFTFNSFQENTYIIYDDNKECIIIDPGCHTNHEKEQLRLFIKDKGLLPVKLINTHCHIDHILGNQFVSNEWGIELSMHKNDLPLLEKSVDIAKAYFIDNYNESPYPKKLLVDGDKINLGNNIFKILFTPGHSPGHICLYNEKHSILISGDVIFNGSIGRTDLPGGDYNQLITSINNKLLCLPDKTTIYPGHGPISSLGNERKNNPFLQA